MSEIFLKVLNMSISATYLVLAVLLLRLLIKKAPKWVSVLLWGIVAVRLICPVSIESILSLVPSGETVSPEIMMDWTPEIQTGISSLDSVVNPVISETFAPDPLTSANPLQILIPVAAVFWLTGVGIMLIYTAVSFLLLRRKVAMAVRLRDRIYQSEKVASPFVLGIIRPKIYLPFAIDGQNMEHVIAHEMSHIRRRDHLWKPLGFLILTIHWFNPLMWIGYIFLCRDIELACDEKVIRKLDSDEKANYTQALVACSVGRLRIAACPLAFGEVGIKERVKSVLNYKKPAFWIIVVAIVASIVTAVCFLTDPIKDKEDTEQFFSEGYLFFDIDAESMESIKSCTIIHDGNHTELILSEEDTLLFARYAYTDKVPVPELSEVFTYPKTKHIQIALGDRKVLLYLMQDGRIAVNLPEKGFCMYQAEEQDVITPAKYEQLVAKYTTEPNTPNKDQQSRPTITFRVNSSRPEYTAVVNYSNASAVTAQSITITDRAAKKDIQTINVSGNELFAEKVLYAADITFDGNLDILIPYERPASAAYFQAYVWQESEGQFVYAPQFENLPNFVIDKENNRILTTRTSSQITSYSICYYDAQAKDFRPSHSIYWEPDASDSKMHFVEKHNINGVKVIVKDCQVEKSSHLDVNKADPQIAEYFAAGSFWDLDSQKWKNQFYKLSQNGTTEGTEDPYPIREITDETISTKGDIKFFNNGQLTLRVPNSWKCFTASGEDDVAYYFRDPVWGEKCQLRVNVTFAHYYSGKELTQEDCLKALSRFYEDVAIESLSKETIRGYACTKLVYSYTEDNTKFIKISYDGLIEGPRLYEFVIKCPAEERENYKNTFSSIMNSVQFLLTDGEISSLELDEAYAYAEKQYKEEPLNHRYICDLQPETQQIIALNGKYYQSYVAPNEDIRYIWISQAEFPDNRQSLWDWYPVGSSRVYSLDLLGKIDEGRKGGETDQIDPADMLLLSVLYNNQSFYCYEGPYSENVKHTISDYHRDIWKFTVVDMDGDRKNELAVQFFDGDILLLRQDNGVVYGNLFGMRGMYRIFKNGTFLWNSDAGSINGCAKLRFTEEGAKTIELWRVERDDSGGVTYYVDDKQVTEAEWNAMMQQDNSEEEVWFTYSG